MRIDIYHHFVHSAGVDEHLEYSLAKIISQGAKIMTAISDFAAKQNAHNTKVSDDLGAIAALLQAQNDLIKTLQNSAGPISPEDQATLDQLEANGQALQDKADALVAVPPPVLPASQAV